MNDYSYYQKECLIAFAFSRLTEDPNVPITTAEKHDYALKQASLNFTQMLKENDKVIQNRAQVQQEIVNAR